MFTYFFQDRTSNKSYFEILGQEKIELLVQDFYSIMETDPRAKNCLALHPIIEGKVHLPAKEKLTSFLIGWLGGPNVFVEKYGPPRMRARHLHVQINSSAKDEWLYCMEKALRKTGLTRKEKTKLMKSFLALAMRIQNA